MVWETRGEGRRDHRYWRRRTAVLFVATVACMAVLVVRVGGSAVRASSQSATRSLPQGVGAGDFAPSPGMVAELRRQAEEDRARRESGPARQARVRSRRAHAGLSRDAAVAVARAAHRNVLEAGPSSPFRLRGGERLLGYVGSDEARVQLADGSKARVESTLPLRARNAAGDLAPVDLSFADRGSFFSPGNPLTALRVAKRLGGGISLGDVGVRVLPAGGGDVQGSLVSGTPFWANVDTDTDMLVKPLPNGAESFWQLRSQDSPEQLRLKLDLPAGAQLRLASTGAGAAAGPEAVEVVKAGKVVAKIAAPGTRDADGQPVPTSMRVDGQDVVVSVAHHGRDVAYPLMVDPTMAVSDPDWYASNSSDFDGWVWFAGNINSSVPGPMWDCPGLIKCSDFFNGFPNYPADPSGCVGNAGCNGAWGRGLYTASVNGDKPAGSWGQWMFVAGNQGPEVNIARAEFKDAWGNYGCSPAGCYIAHLQGLWNPTGWVSSWATTSGYSYSQKTYCTPAACDAPTNGQNATVASQQIYTPTGGTFPYNMDFLMSASVVMTDDTGPNSLTATHSNQPPSGWVHDTSETVTASAADGGVGVKEFDVIAHKPDGTTQTLASAVNPCPGNRHGWCPATWSTPVPYSTQPQPGADYPPGLPEGDNTVSIGAKDAWDNPTDSTPWHAKIDRTPPDVALSGALYDQRNGALGDSTYQLAVDATDGTGPGAAARSGIQSVELKVDGRTEKTVTPDCSGAPDNCKPQPFTWDFQAGQYGEGKHTIQVVANDRLAPTPGHTKTESFDVTVRPAETEKIGPGSVNLLSGEFSLPAQDVSIDSYGASLTLSRTYRSDDPAAGDNTMFGPGWTSSLPVEEAGADYARLVEMPSGTAILVFSDGKKAAFPKGSGGTYSRPQGYENLAVTKPAANRYRVADSDGNTTTFAQESARPNATKTYFATQVTQPGSPREVSYSYEVVDGVTRPTRALAPPPAGVDCSGTLTAGCRALTFDYATSTTASGQGSGDWGDYEGRVKRIRFTAYDAADGQMKTDSVAEYSYDDQGRLRAAWDPRISPTLKTSYSYDQAGYLTSVAPPGQETWTLAYAPNPPSPSDPRPLRSVSRPALPGTATTTVAYKVPVSGAGAPYQMGSSTVAAWGQNDAPKAATAIFPPDQVPGDPPTSYSRASIHYLDSDGREVNVAGPGGRITTTEHDNNDNVVRELTAANRERALAASNPSARAAELDTRRTYTADGLELTDEYGPLHEVKLASGERIAARRHTQTDYDQGAPGGGPYHLPTTVTVSAAIPGRSDADARVTKTGYDWSLRQPTSVTKDARSGGLNLTSTTVYDSATGLPVEKRQPANPNGGDAHATKTVYYTAGANGADQACANNAAWANQPCKVLPAAQPQTPGLPDIPVRTYGYNRLNQPVTSVETSGSKMRSTTTTYDTAGRTQTVSVSSAEGVAMPTVTTTYDPAQGVPVSTTTTEGGTTKSITREYDTLGRIFRYTDADANVSTTTYDLLGRPKTTTDGKGEQTRTYDAATGELTQLTDAAAGAFTAAYNADGQLLRQDMPNGLRATTTYDESGTPTKLEYQKITGCAIGCLWYQDDATYSIHGQRTTQASTLSQREYSYDGAGRLTRAADTSGIAGCTVRDYGYDADTNRKSITSHRPALGGGCDPGSAGTTKSYQYDQADRLKDSGYQYDAFGRTQSVPASDAGGGVGQQGALTNTYYADDRIHSLTQNATTNSYQLDPGRRVRTETTAGASSATRTNHFDDDSDSPAWTAEDVNGAHWTRNITGIDGNLVAIQDSQTGTQLQLSNLHGDIIGTPSLNAALGPILTPEPDEFGVRQPETLPTLTPPTRYGWLGAKQRQTAVPTGAMLMGQRVYQPTIGRFLQTDPVEGGSANDYDYTNQDPATQVDLDGTYPSNLNRTEFLWCTRPWHLKRCKMVGRLRDQLQALSYRWWKSPTLLGVRSAFRHCAGSGITTLWWGAKVAKGFGDRHEDYKGNDAHDKGVDLWNNRRGRLIAEYWLHQRTSRRQRWVTWDCQRRASSSGLGLDLTGA